MKLANFYAAIGAMNKLAKASLAPKAAYSVLKFMRKFEVEAQIVDKQNDAIIHEICGTKPGEASSVTPGTPEFNTYMEKFSVVLDTDSDLEVCPLKFSALLDALEAEEGNVLSAQDLALMEVFFEADEEEKPEEKKPDLEIAK